MSSVGDVLITDAMAVLPTGTCVADLRAERGVITEILPGGGLHPRGGSEVHIDGRGLHLLPGAIDPQVHFREPGQPEKEDLGSGSRAAVSGGVTAFLDMPNNEPAATTVAAIEAKIASAGATAVAHHGFFIGATPNNLGDLQEAVGTPEAPVARPGVCGIKIFMGSSTGSLLVSEEGALDRIFEGTAGLIAVHAEDEARLIERKEAFAGRTDMAAHAEWRDDVTALLATQLAVNLATTHGHRLHVLHLTSGLEADWLAGRTRLPSDDGEGPCITVETLPQHLTFDEKDVDEQGTRLKMNPPIRYAADRETLWKRLHDGTINCMATDHAPHTLEAKALGFPAAPSGMPGVETSLPVMLTHAARGACTIEDVVRWMSTNVADCYAMVGKGRLKVGADADIVLVDMVTQHRVDDANAWSRVGWNPFHGRSLVGWPVWTLVDGVPVFERSARTGPKGEVLVAPGSTGRPLVMMPWA
jgi:dihydroorotase